MGRHKKKVPSEHGMDRRSLGYYSTPEWITQYLTERMLGIHPTGRRVLDPCVGREEMCGFFAAAGLDVIGFDVVDHGHHVLADFHQQDFLEYYQRRKDAGSLPAQEYDFFIANPPYNCHEVDYIRRNKAILKNYFGQIGTLNMYSLFLAAMVDMAAPESVIGVLTSDSFLTNRLHGPLRHWITEQCHVHDVILCPKDLFHHQKADVRTCILVMQKKPARAPNRVKTLPRLEEARMLRQILLPTNEQTLANEWRSMTPETLILDHEQDYGEWVIDCPEEVRSFFHRSRLGDHFPCVSGISTGSDRTYLRQEPSPGWEQPFFKNPGSRRFFSHPDGYLPDDYEAIAGRVSNFLVRNRQHLGKEGIACSSMGVAFGACYRPSGSLFGVNANFVDVGEDLWWLLGYLNSSLVTYLLRGVLLRSNIVTSGYVSRIPLVPLGEETKTALAHWARKGYRQARNGSRGDVSVIEAIDRILYDALDISMDVRQHVSTFCGALVRRT